MRPYISLLHRLGLEEDVCSIDFFERGLLDELRKRVSQCYNGDLLVDHESGCYDAEE